jgi:hypothetical protein
MSVLPRINIPIHLTMVAAMVIAMLAMPAAVWSQEEQPEQPGQPEIVHRQFATLEQRQEAAEMTINERCEQDHWVFRPGESLGLITVACGIPLDFMLAVNPQISNPDLVFVNERVTMAEEDADPMTLPRLTEPQLAFLQERFGIEPVVVEPVEPIIPITGTAEFQQEAVSRTVATEQQRQQHADMTLEQRCEQDQWVFMSGESLGFITARCGIPLDFILAVNPQISFPDLVFTGERVSLPAADADPATLPVLTQAQLEYLQERFDVEPVEPVDDEEVEEEVEDEEEEEEEEEEGEG